MKKADFKFKKLYKKAITKDIKKLRKEGASFKEISELYNTLEGFETLSDDGKWYPQSVHRLCK